VVIIGPTASSRIVTPRLPRLGLLVPRRMFLIERQQLQILVDKLGPVDGGPVPRDDGSDVQRPEAPKRSRSTLSKPAEHYRKTQPWIFADAEHALMTYLRSCP
jgi:hypothetical protein